MVSWIAEKITKTCFVVVLFCASAALASPLHNQVQESDNAEAESSEPSVASALPPTEDPLQNALPPVEDPIQKVLQAVVKVTVSVREGARTESTFGKERSGSGVVIDSAGLIATAGYIVAEAETVTVTFANGVADEAEIVAYDDSIGVGIVRTKNFRSTQALRMGNSAAVSYTHLTLPTIYSV